MHAFLQRALIITSPYGWRKHPVTGQNQFHNGIDCRAKYDILYAPEDGVIKYVGEDEIAGLYLGLQPDFDPNVRLEFAHLDSVAHIPGNKVGAGSIIGTSGNSGRSTAPHLHFSYKYLPKVDGRLQHKDPAPYAYKVQSKEILKTAVPIGVLGAAIAVGIYYGTKS